MKRKIVLFILTLLASLAIVACTEKVKELTLDSSTLQLEVGEIKEVAINATDGLTLKATSSNPAVATVVISGSTLKVTGVASGSSVIEVVAEGIEVDGKPLKARLNVSVKAQAQGARFEGHTGVFLVDVGYPLEDEIAEATKNIKAYDDDGTLIPAENIKITGIETIDVTAAEGTRFQLEISATKKDGTKLTAVITVEIFGQSVEERVVIFGPSKLTYYIGSEQQGFDLQKEFSARNLNTKQDVPVNVEYLMGKEITLSTPGRHNIIVSATDGDVSATKTVELFVKQAANIKGELRGTSVGQEIVIEFGHGNGSDIEALFKKYAGWFEEEMQSQGHYVKVNVVKLGDNYDSVRDNVTSAMQSGTAISHIVQNYPDHLVEYHGYNKIISLTPYVFHPVWGLNQNDPNESYYDLVQSYRDEQRVASLEGDILSMPFNKSTEFILYNKDMFDEVLKGAPFPETWEDLFELAPALRGQIDANIARIAAAYTAQGNSTYTADVQAAAKDQFYPFSYDSTGNAFITLTKAWGGQYTAQTGTKQQKLLFVNDQTKQMLRFFGSHRTDFTVPPVWNNARYATDLFLKGYSAFSVSSTAGADKNTPLIGTTKLFNIGVAPMLYSKFHPENRNVIQQGTNFAITNEGDEDQRIVAWLFLKFLNTKRVSLDYAFEKGYFPTRNSSLNSQEYQDFLALANNPIYTGIAKAEADKIMRAKAATIYLEQKDFMVFDLPFKGSSGVRQKVGPAFQDVILALPTDDLEAKIEAALTNAYNESLRLVSDD
ncbi:MAG: extracellular solute-binding protein [Acholeplasmataceae bacterium]|nr:extracellular solute-binding protein [Acholeplasmataceae bacterium]